MKHESSKTCSSFQFSAVLCAIILITNLVGYAVTGDSNVAMIPFLCFLPMAFWMTDYSSSQTREHIAALETRIRELEQGGSAE